MMDRAIYIVLYSASLISNKIEFKLNKREVKMKCPKSKFVVKRSTRVYSGISTYVSITRKRFLTKLEKKTLMYVQGINRLRRRYFIMAWWWRWQNAGQNNIALLSVRNNFRGFYIDLWMTKFTLPDWFDWGLIIIL